VALIPNQVLFPAIALCCFKYAISRAEETKNETGGKIMGKEAKGKQAERKAFKKTAAYLRKGPINKKRKGE